jgi:hypothetical protein
MRAKMMGVLALAATIGLVAGCRQKTVDKSAFKSALNDYYKARPDCLWTSARKFPVQADTSNDEQTGGYDALVDAGLLVRSSAEKKRFLVGSKQVNNYDLSDKGRSSWTPEPAQPGYGNFCFGHADVISVDSYVPPEPGAPEYTVNYRYGVTHLPDWADTAEMKTAYPTIARQSSGAESGSATLVKSGNVWQVSNAQPAATVQSGQ